MHTDATNAFPCAHQTVLEKFEYLPIKCHVINGRRTFLKYSEEVAQNDFWDYKLKSKVALLQKAQYATHLITWAFLKTYIIPD
jgi:hypothetical protein